jgi:hypothetical protein
VVLEGDYVACQTTIAGTFVREFTHSPVGPLPPTGDPVVFELMNFFRYDDAGRLAEEGIQTDNRSCASLAPRVSKLRTLNPRDPRGGLIVSGGGVCRSPVE